jgi:opacity protein-like surface antigen
MKKYLILSSALTLALSAQASRPFEGTFFGVNVGTARTTTESSIDAHGIAFPTHKEKPWGLHGGVALGHRAFINEDILLGVSLEGELSKADRKEEIKYNGETFSLNAKRNYNVNLIGHLGYRANKRVLPYVLGGAVHTQFKFNGQANSEHGKKTKNAFGVIGGLGVDYALSDTVTGNIQYAYSYYGKNKLKDEEISYLLPEDYHAVTVGIKFNF